MRKVYVETLGEGPDLVLLHGWAMHSGIWESVRSQLATTFSFAFGGSSGARS